jgi:hypothetical protein
MTSLAVSGEADFSGTVAIQDLKVNTSLESKAFQAGSGTVNGALAVGGAVAFDSTLLVKKSIGIGTDKVEGCMLSVDGKTRTGRIKSRNGSP